VRSIVWLAFGLSCWALMSAAARAQSPGEGDWIPGQRLKLSLGRVLDKAKKLAETQDYAVAEDISLFAGFVLDGESLILTRELKAQQSYRFFAAGDRNAIDVDLAILDRDGQVLVEDTDDDAEPIVRFTPKTDGSYKLRLSLEGTKDDKVGSFLSLIGMSTEGYTVPGSNLDAMLKQLGERLNAAQKTAMTKFEKELFFHSGNGGIALFGAVLEPDENLTIQGLSLIPADYLILSASDRNAKNLDLIAMNATKKILKSCEDDDDNPVLVFGVTANTGKVNVQLKNVDAKGPTFCMFSVLRFRDQDPNPK